MNQTHSRFAPRRSLSQLFGLLALAAGLALSGCGGGGGGGGGGGNRAPVASFTVAPDTGAAPLLVTVNAAASSDPDGSISSYAWNFGDSSSGSGVSTTHTYNAAGTFTITLTVTDNLGRNGTTTRSVTVSSGPPPPDVVVSGRITYERVPFKTSLGAGLDYPGTFEAPARGIVVELIRSSDQGVLFTTSTDGNGTYSFGSVPGNTNVKVRAKAQSRSTSGATWNVQVKDNTNSNALYVMDSASFNTGTANVTRNLLADSGAGGFCASCTDVYTSTRVAAPFAILDTLYSAVQFVVTQGDDPSIALPALDVFWSPSNQPSTGNFDPASGNIQTTQYQNGPGGGIFVLGKQNVDTDEYDEHVLTHEFQHYLQDNTSRDDSMGGAHSLGENHDLRLAFSEGYANAFSGMPLDDSLYRDSSGSKQSGDGFFNLETVATGTAGWFNESTISALAWDLWDSTVPSDDTVALPYSTIASAFRNQLRTGQPVTSIFPLIVTLKASNPAAATAINALVGTRGMVAASMDAFGSTETNGGGNGDALPVYSNVALNGASVRVCGNNTDGTYNALGNRRLLKFSLGSTVNATIQAVFTLNGSDPAGATTVPPDPDIVLYKGGQIAISESSAANQETLVRTLDAGDYVIEVYEYSHIEAPTSGTARGRTCYNVSITG